MDEDAGSRLGRFQWQSGYGGFSMSAREVDSVVRYIEQQEEHHKAMSFEEEYRRFLKAYEVEYDERYVWD
jgi:putative transposase